MDIHEVVCALSVHNLFNCHENFQSQFYVYILSNSTRSVLYIGVTNNLERRIEEHYYSVNANAFTSTYNCHNLVYYEKFCSIKAAIAREKELKNWRRKWKDDLISEFNPKWQNLNFELFDKWPPDR